MKKLLTMILGMFLLAAGTLSAEPGESAAWRFDSPDDAAGWSAASMTPPKIVDGSLCATFTGRDPFFITPDFQIKPRAGQMIELRLKTVSRGGGEIFWAESHAGENGGFSQSRAISWPLKNDGQWHRYRIFPAWSNLPKIIKFRIDFGTPNEAMFNQNGVELDYVRIVDANIDALPETDGGADFMKNQTNGWFATSGLAEPTAEGLRIASDGKTAATVESEFFSTAVDPRRSWLSVTMKTVRGNFATLRYAGTKTGSVVSVPIPLQLEENAGGFVTYNVHLGAQKNWGGKIFLFGLSPSDDPAAVSTVQKITLGSGPVGPAQIFVRDVGLTEALNRTGTPLPLVVDLKNTGGESAANLRFSIDRLPEGIKLYADSSAQKEIQTAAIPIIEPFESAETMLTLKAEKPFQGKIAYKITGDGLRTKTGAFDVNITPNLNLPKADYVPEPQPAKLLDPKLEIGALYFPGWPRRAAWERIRPVAPIRKPVLGWYDEGNPEVIDWQIKWALESGISFFLVDWYWSRGRISLDHWVKAFQKARYRSQFKWAMMWANHNGAGSHSLEDQAAVTKYWIEHYFNTPEYYTIDGKPVVMIWSVEGMDLDMINIEKAKGKTLRRGEGVKMLLDLSRKMAVEAGFKGIYFVAMKWPEASFEAKDIDWLAEAGFDMTSIYHYMYPGKGVESGRLFEFDRIVESSPLWWRSREKTGILPFLPNLSTGWDDRPWNNHLVIANRTPEKFRKICEELNTFLGESGIKRITLAPINEWGEGSYAEPNREFGFGMYEALRETFCEKPAGGWPLFYGPSDVGLGPYDLPLEKPVLETSWKFDGPATSWKPAMGIEAFQLKDGVCAFKTINADPALNTSLASLRAGDFRRLVVRMKLTAENGAPSDTVCQLFWATKLADIQESQSLHVSTKIDGAFHDVVFDLSSSPLWENRVTALRFDPVSAPNIAVEIESIRFE